MRYHVTHLRLFFIALTVMLASTALAQNQQPYEPPTSFDEAIHTPEIKDNKVRNAIVNYQMRQAQILSENRKLNIMTIRDKEVIIISIPADLLFEPNQTELSSEADNVLRVYCEFLQSPDFYHMALVMHHDNSASESFSNEITQLRVQSVYDWFVANATSVRYVSKFYMGNREPIMPNNSINNRRQNRRLEIYLIPGNAMIEQAKRNQLR